MRQRRGDPANTVREFAEIASGERAILQEIEQECVHVASHPFDCVECERITIALICVEASHLRVTAMCEQREARL
jgi:hypothetical protein